MPSFDPNFGLGAADAAMIQRAAYGDRAAQTVLAEASLRTYEAAVANGAADDLAAYQALFFARLSAAGGDHADAMRLSTALAYASNSVAKRDYGDLAETLTVEVLAILSALAEAGHVEAAGTISHVIADMSPKLVQRAAALAASSGAASAS